MLPAPMRAIRTGAMGIRGSLQWNRSDVCTSERQRRTLRDWRSLRVRGHSRGVVRGKPIQSNPRSAMPPSSDETHVKCSRSAVGRRSTTWLVTLPAPPPTSYARGWEPSSRMYGITSGVRAAGTLRWYSGGDRRALRVRVQLATPGGYAEPLPHEPGRQAEPHGDRQGLSLI